MPPITLDIKRAQKTKMKGKIEVIRAKRPNGTVETLLIERLGEKVAILKKERVRAHIIKN